MMISIILPVYNKQKYIQDTLMDIKNQTFEEYECILVDDGSIDSSGDICDQFAALDNRFKVIHTINQGVSEARNTGMNYATGELFTFIDGDDRITPVYLEHLYECFISSESDMVISNLAKVWSDGRKEMGILFPYSGKKSMEDILPEFVKYQQNIGLYGFCVGKLFRRDLISGILFDKTIKLAEDFDFYLRLYERINTIYFDNHCNYYYLQEADNSSFVTDDYKIDYMTQLKINLRVKSFLEKKENYCNENKSIQDQVIAQYIYYCLFYSNLENLNDVYCELKKLVLQYNLVPINSTNMRQKIIMKLFWTNYPNMIRSFLRVFRSVRNILKR